MGASMCVPVCMLVLTSTVLLRSRWCVVMSVTSMDANCGQVGMRSPQGWVRSTILKRSFLGFGPGCDPALDPAGQGGEDDAKRHDDHDGYQQVVGLERVTVADDQVADAGDRR